MTTPNQQYLSERFDGLELFDIVIPHHNRADHLKNCLESIPLGFRVFVVRGGTFAESCNKGFCMTSARRVLFLNDDTILNENILFELAVSTGDIIGAKFIRGDGSFLTNGVKINPWPEGGYFKFNAVQDPADADFPAGGAFLVRNAVFNAVNGFRERYRNGAEDCDFFLSAMDKGYRFEYIDTPIIHHHSQSLDRLKYSRENFRLLKARFPVERVERILERTRGVKA